MASAAGPVDNSRAWLLAVAPILSLCLDAALLFSGYAEAAIVSALIAVAVNVAISVWDSRYVQSRGYDVSTGLAVFLVPIYLWQRSKRTGQSQGLLAAWIAIFVLSIAGSAALSGRYVAMDMQAVEAMVTSGIDQQLQTASTVSCPSKTLYSVGSTFLCDVSDSTGTAHVQVKVQNSAGDITWNLIG